MKEEINQLPPTLVGGLSLIWKWSNRNIFLPPSSLIWVKQLRLLFRKFFLNPQVDELRQWHMYTHVYSFANENIIPSCKDESPTSLLFNYITYFGFVNYNIYHTFKIWEQKKNGWTIYQPIERRDFNENIIPSCKDESLTSLLFNYIIYLWFVKHLFIILKIGRLIVGPLVLIAWRNPQF